MMPMETLRERAEKRARQVQALRVLRDILVSYAGNTVTGEQLLEDIKRVCRGNVALGTEVIIMAKVVSDQIKREAS